MSSRDTPHRDAAVNEVSPAIEGRLVSADGSRTAIWRVAEEQPIAILLNGQTFAVMMATPADLEDFALGFALTEGIVDRIGEVEKLRIAAAGDGMLANLTVPAARLAAASGRRRSLAGRAGCGICGAQSLAAALPPPRRVHGPPPESAAVRTAFAGFHDAQPMNRVNRSTHAAAYCRADGTIAVLREDIGRHNALDKVAGALARAGEIPGDGFVILSSRISVELVQKAAAMGISFLAAVSAPSALALRLAGRAGMTLAGLSGEGVMLFPPKPPAREHAA